MVNFLFEIPLRNTEAFIFRSTRRTGLSRWVKNDRRKEVFDLFQQFTGEQGEKGDKGDRGEEGVGRVGPPGPQGPQGPSGKTHSSRKLILNKFSIK